MEVARFDVFRVIFDPAQGSEMRKTRPSVVVSPDEMNRHLRTAIVAPMTTVSHGYPSRVACRFRGRRGEVALDQMRVVEKSRLVKRLGALDDAAASRVLGVLAGKFAR